MATFRELILAASTLTQGAKLREHLNNLGSGGGEGTIVHEQFEARLDDDIQVSLQYAEEVSVVLEEITVDIEETDISATEEQIQVDI